MLINYTCLAMSIVWVCGSVITGIIVGRVCGRMDLSG
jgi:glycerol-3-phosphate acyltransferase PlsY